jgi:hypothetical protein
MTVAAPHDAGVRPGIGSAAAWPVAAGKSLFGSAVQ